MEISIDIPGLGPFLVLLGIAAIVWAYSKHKE